MLVLNGTGNDALTRGSELPRQPGDPALADIGTGVSTLPGENRCRPKGLETLPAHHPIMGREHQFSNVCSYPDNESGCLYGDAGRKSPTVPCPL